MKLDEIENDIEQLEQLEKMEAKRQRQRQIQAVTRGQAGRALAGSDTEGAEAEGNQEDDVTSSGDMTCPDVTPATVDTHECTHKPKRRGGDIHIDSSSRP